MKNVFLLICGTIFSFCASVSHSETTVQAADCNEKSVDLSALKENLVLKTNFNEIEVWIYNRNRNQINKSHKSSSNGFETKAPWWWQINKHPIDFNLSQTTLRSINEDFFVFYGRNPVNGYILMYFSESNNARSDYEYLANKWEGGFVDVVNNIAYDFTGRPVAKKLKNEATQEERDLSKLNLLVPKYTFSKLSNTIKLLCK